MTFAIPWFEPPPKPRHLESGPLHDATHQTQRNPKHQCAIFNFMLVFWCSMSKTNTKTMTANKSKKVTICRDWEGRRFGYWKMRRLEDKDQETHTENRARPRSMHMPVHMRTIENTNTGMKIPTNTTNMVSVTRSVFLSWRTMALRWIELLAGCCELFFSHLPCSRVQLCPCQNSMCLGPWVL